MILRRTALVLVILAIAGAAFVGWRGYLRDERVFLVSDDEGWYVECTYQRVGGKERTYDGGWHTQAQAEAQAWCPFIRR